MISDPTHVLRQVFATVEQASELCRTLDAAKRSAMFEYLQHCHMDVLSPLQARDYLAHP